MAANTAVVGVKCGSSICIVRNRNNSNKLYKNVPGVPPPKMHLLEPCIVRKKSLHLDPRCEFRFICCPSPGLVGLDGALQGPALPSREPVKKKRPDTSILVMQKKC